MAGTVHSVRFTGPGLRATYFDDLIVTRNGEPLRQGELHADRMRIVSALVAVGHLDAAVEEPLVRWSSEDGGAWVEFRVDAGPRYIVRSVRIDGKHASRTGIAAALTLQPGHEVISQRIDGNVEVLRAWLDHRGIRATVSAHVELDRFTQQVDLVFSAN